jgi:ATP-dependent protease ClpP protease subunit
MPDRQNRFRGAVEPSAAVKRPVAVHRPKAADSADASGTKGTSATIDIFDVIDSWGGWWGISASEVDAALKQVGDVETLYVRINSPGGEATEGVAIANLLRAHSSTVRVTVYGLAASAASLIAVAGDVVSMAPGSMLMIHDAWDFGRGSADDFRKQADVLDAISDGYAGVYASKAGGTAAQWRAVMREDKWYGADAAVAAKLADVVGLDPALPDNLPAVEEDDTDDDAIVIELDIELSPAARAAARRFDLSMLPNAPAALAPKTPAEPPVPPPNNKEADVMSDTLIQGLRERFGLPEDADEATVLAKLDELEEQATAPKADDPVVEPDATAVAASLAKNGKVAVSQAYLDTLKEGAEAGKAALARQHREDRDTAIAKAQTDGKIGRSDETVTSWQAAWDRDPINTAKEIEALGTRFPVGQLQGHQGDDGTPGGNAAFTDDEAAELAALTGTSKEALQS